MERCCGAGAVAPKPTHGHHVGMLVRTSREKFLLSRTSDDGSLG